MPGSNPFILAAARGLLRKNEVEVGSRVTVTWQFNGEATPYDKTGTVESLDEWIRIGDCSESPGHLYLPITALVTVRNLDIEKAAAA